MRARERTRMKKPESGQLLFLLGLLLLCSMTARGEDSLYNMDDLPASSSSSSSSADFDLPKSPKCQPLSAEVLSICDNLSYNKTRFPNFILQKSQHEAAEQLASFAPLIKINCSRYYKLFMCTMYVPPCVENTTEIIKPCRELCETVRNSCEGIMKRFSSSWPAYLDCYKMSSNADKDRPCIDYEDYNSFVEKQQQQQASPKMMAPSSLMIPHQVPLGASPNTLISSLNSQQKQNILNQLSQPGANNVVSPNLPFTNENFYRLYNALLAAAGEVESRIRIKFVCPQALQVQEGKNAYYLKVNDETVKNCAMPCDNSIFEKSEITFTRSWVLIWSTICFLSTTFTILTFLIDRSRFRYPERPIICISVCYMIVALAYMIGSSAISNNSIVCRPQKNGLGETREFIVQGVEHIPCTLLFMMIYFFGMAAALWWDVLMLTWFLSASFQWTPEAIHNIASYFHLLAWAIPGAKMIALLWLQSVDADILSGVCYTGLRNVNVLRGFVLAPSILYLVIGSCFLLAGFVSLFRIRNIMKDEGHKSFEFKKFERFMMRIGFFSILYIVPTILVICCYFYEAGNYSKWIDYWLRHNLVEFNVQPDFVTHNLFENDRSALVLSFFNLKFTMTLVVGITSGFWIWSPKTIVSWRKFLTKLVSVLGHLQPKYKNEASV